MGARQSALNTASPRAWTRGEAIYAVVLFGIALAVLGTATAIMQSPFDGLIVEAALFFVLFGLFTISIGYYHPNVGYCSFDRIAQVASILVLGPLPAAWVNGIASLLYPWHRLRKGVPLRDVCLASLHNAGLMTLVVLIGGSVYAALGGSIPLTSVDTRSAMLLVLLVLSMQILNDLGMLAMHKAGRRDTSETFQPFSAAMELGSGAAAVLVAIVYNLMDLQILVLLLGVMTLGMLALRQFANMRISLEQIVAERTESLQEKTRELEQLATQDNLTGLFNRRYAETYLRERIEAMKDAHEVFSIALADIDLFKQINDLHSHSIGDEVLMAVADILQRRCRESDIIARYGGEEFLICFPETNLSGACNLCEELRLAVEKYDWSRLGLGHGVTLSFGIAEARPDLSMHALIHTADLRLYAAKRGGRNLVAV